MCREGVLAPPTRAPHCETARWSCGVLTLRFSSYYDWLNVCWITGTKPFPKQDTTLLLHTKFYSASTASPLCPSHSLAGAGTSQPTFGPARPSVVPCLRNARTQIDEIFLKSTKYPIDETNNTTRRLNQRKVYSSLLFCPVFSVRASSWRAARSQARIFA